MGQVLARGQPPTPHELLQPLAWLVGDWVSEGGDSVVRISYRWSDDGNFLLGDYKVDGQRANRDGQCPARRLGSLTTASAFLVI